MNAEREIIKEYSNGDLIVIWKPKQCIHAAECVKRLPDVYDPNAKPWIKAENASTDELKAQIKTCPSGALSYRIGNKEVFEEAHLETKVEVLKNGPLLVYGTLHVTKPNGDKEKKTKQQHFVDVVLRKISHTVTVLTLKLDFKIKIWAIFLKILIPNSQIIR